MGEAKGRSRGRLLAATIVLAVAVLAGWHYWTLYTGLRDAKADLITVDQLLSAGGFDITAEGLDGARANLASARGNLGDVRTHMRWDPIIALAGILPGSSDQVGAARDILDMADILVDVGDEAVAAGAKAVVLRDGAPSGEPLTKTLVDLLNDTGPEIERIGASVEELVAKREAMGDRKLLPPLNDIRERIDGELPQLANLVEQARQSKALIPGFLGFDRDRRYLVVALNSGELLPGGGLVTASGILPVSKGVNGQLDFTDSVLWKGLAEAKGVPYIEPPPALKRYLLRDYTWNLLVANWSPDFPTWSQQALEFYELIYGPQGVDGVIAVDLTVLERLLSVTGPKTIDVNGAPVSIDTESSVLVLEALTRHAFDPTAEDRKSVIGDLAQVLLADLLTLPSERWGDAIKVIRELGAERHIQVISFDAAEQTIVRDFGWDGRLNQPEHDFVQMNEASVLSTKLNLIMKPEGTYRISLNELGDAQHEMRLTYRNPVDEWAKGKEPAFVEQLMLGGLYGGYLRIFGPKGIRDYGVAVDGEAVALEDIGSEANTDWFATFMPLAPGTVKEIAFSWTSTPPGGLAADGYRLSIQKQPGTDGMCLALSIDHAGEPARELIISGGTRDAQGRVCLTTDVEVVAHF